MDKSYITTSCFQCPVCGVKVLEEWRTSKKPSPREIAKMNETSRDNHLELHNTMRKYRRIEDAVSRLYAVISEKER